jgi:hypothetical protein
LERLAGSHNNADIFTLTSDSNGAILHVSTNDIANLGTYYFKVKANLDDGSYTGSYMLITVNVEYACYQN